MYLDKIPAYGTVERECLNLICPWITPRLTKSNGKTAPAPRNPKSTLLKQ